MCPIKETLEFNYWEFGRATKEYPEIFNSRSAWKPEISWLDLSRQQQSCLYSIRGRLAGFKKLSFSIFHIHLSNQEWKMLGKETNWISIKLNDLNIAQFYPYILTSETNILEIILCLSQFFLSKNAVAINSKWADWGNTNELSNIQLYIDKVGILLKLQSQFKNIQSTHHISCIKAPGVYIFIRLCVIGWFLLFIEWPCHGCKTNRLFEIFFSEV